MDQFKKVIEESIAEKIRKATNDKFKTFILLTEVKFIIKLYNAELARNKELGV